MAGGKRRTGPLFCLQRTSRAADGTPLHIRMDGPGFDAMAVPGGASVPKLQFTIFRADAEFFRTLRTSQASLDLQNKYSVSVEDNGLERFLTPPGGRTSRFPAPSPSRTSLTSVIVPMPTAPLACHGVYDEPFPRNRRAVPNDLPCRYEHQP